MVLIYTVWEKAWLVEDLYRESTSVLNKDNDLLVKAIVRTKYLTWWELSEKFPNLIINICEMMAKLVSHASKLKCDDVRLKVLAASYRVCSECDFHLKEDLFHVVMHCPSTEVIRYTMHSEFEQYDDRINGILNPINHKKSLTG